MSGCKTRRTSPTLFYFFVLDQGALYEFCVSALNAVDYGEQAVVTIQTPDGSVSRHVSCAFLDRIHTIAI